MELEDNSAEGCEGTEVESIVRYYTVYLMAWLKYQIMTSLCDLQMLLLLLLFATPTYSKGVTKKLLKNHVWSLARETAVCK